MRLNQYLAACGLGSRRGCESLIRDGQVMVNGERCTNLGTRVAPGDEVVCGGRKLKPLKPVTFVLNKPRGYVCTRSTEQNERTIYDLIPQELKVANYVGRLDRESEGLVLMTNDGHLSQRLTHPTNKVEKDYVVSLGKPFDARDKKRLITGFEIPEGFARAEYVEVISPRRLGIVLTQGLKRQIRQMLDTLGYPVTRLVRVRVGPLEIGSLQSGKWRRLSQDEERQLGR